MLEMEKAQVCVSKCKHPEIIFNRATLLNENAAGAFIDKCISKVGLKDFRGYDTNDPNITEKQANRMLFCLTAGKHISTTIDRDLNKNYLEKYKDIIEEMNL